MIKLIKSPAIKNITTDEIFTGNTHGDIKHDMILAKKFVSHSLIEGFITTDGQFVNRETAYDIAEKANQLDIEDIRRKLKTWMLNKNI